MEVKYKLKRPHGRIIRFDSEENEYINHKIEQSPFKSFQNFALHMLIQGEINYIDYSELNSLTSEVRRLGNNVNQIAKLAHQFNEISGQDVKELKVAIQELTQLVLEELPNEKKEERKKY
ncbi:plasmid mobilization relaxosome protein MobC (plasmid) [Carnobacterium maltaromaticum]|uniref:plasmid mobilization relaxosome protein MobC n=1 Tax=Carnobacterium maltaromaticum TaxID=2751 RepID=UPI00344C1835